MSKEGIYHDMSIEDYHTSTGVSNSGVSLLLDCPKRYWHRYLSDTSHSLDTDSFRIGKCFHTCLLEPNTFESRYFVTEKQRRDARSKSWQAVLEEANGRVVIFKDELSQIHEMLDALCELESTPMLLRNGKSEHSLFWNDPQTDVLCKSRPDYFTDKLVVDVKTTDSVESSDFSRSIYKYGYHRQAAIALDGLTKLTGKTYDSFVLLTVEKKAPYCAAAFVLDDVSIQKGREEYRAALEVFKSCQENNQWPGYYTNLTDISIPKWALEQAA